MIAWTHAAFDLVGRNDLAEFLARSRLQQGEPTSSDKAANNADGEASSQDPDNDGLVALEEYSSMIYPDDNRP